jgi:DNA-binding beta-propeller fold protein YncE
MLPAAMRSYRRASHISILAGIGLFLASGSALFGQAVNLYVPNFNNAPANINEFTINGSTGALAPVVGQPTTATDNNPIRVAMTPNGRFMYIASTNGHLDAYSVSPTGTLTVIQAVPGFTAFAAFGIVATNNYVYVSGSGGQIYVFSINQSTGVPTSLACGACTTPAGSNPQNIVLDPSGTHLFVALPGTNAIGVGTISTSGANAGTLTGFNATAYTAPGFTPEDLAITPNGSNLYASNFFGSDTVTVLSVSGATLSGATSAPTGAVPNGLGMDPQGRFLYVANQFDGTVSAFSIGAGGALTAVTGSPFTAGAGAIGASVDPTGTFVYISNNSANSVSGFRITQSGATAGALTSVGAPITTGNGPYYLLAHLAPSSITITSLSPTSGPVSTLITISGSNFGATQDTSTVTFNGTSAGAILTWSDTIIRVAVPSGATTGNVVVMVNGVASGGSSSFTVTNSPIIANLSPGSGPAGTNVTISGLNFGATQGNSTVTFNGVPAAAATAWSDTSISVAVPSGASTGSVIVTVGTSSSTGTPFAVPPVLTSVSPAAGVAGTQVTFSGSGFGSTRGAGTVWLGTTYGTVVSWSDTQIVATIASNSRSGTARVQRAGTWSGTVPFVVNTATISNVTPTSGLSGTQVTIIGTGFGAQQGSGQVWLGTANGVVQSWSDTQVVALVAAGSASGNALILQNGVTSNSVPFTVSTPRITSVSPTSGPVGTSVTISGSGFGLNQGVGAVQVGSLNGQVMSWSDSQVVATVATGSLSGIIRVTQNAIQSNSKSFIVTPPGGSTLTMTPVTLNMMVGETHAIQALNSSNQPVTGLTWASSDTTVVSLSTADPPVLTAVAAGHVTITAGTASADVTVSSVPLAPGTVLWSNPINGAEVDDILPAVPSPTGVADVFAVSGRTVYAITSDGATAWTADLSDFKNYPDLYPDFQGGLVAADPYKVVKLDGATGLRYPAYTAPNLCILHNIAIHPDGTIFANQQVCDYDRDVSVIGIDPTTGTLKFQVPVPHNGGGGGYGLIIAGDGFAYLTYSTSWNTPHTVPDPYYEDMRLGLLRISSSGTFDDLTLGEWYYPLYYAWNCGPPYHPYSCYVGGTPVELPTMITNADTGVLVAWYEKTGADWALRVANVTGSGVSIASGSQPPFSSPALLRLDLQAQDGSFIGVTEENYTGIWYAFSMDAGGNLRWLLPNITPYMATADGGFIGQQDSASPALKFDQYGNATGQIASWPTYSWKGAYQAGSVNSMLPVFDAALIAQSYAAAPKGNLTGNGFSLVHHTFGLAFCGPEGDGTCAPNGTTVTPVQFSYLPGNILSGSTYMNAVDFSAAYPSWVTTIKAQAYNQYRAAFANLPAIVAKATAVPLYGGTNTVHSFEHTAYITGLWPTGSLANATGYTPPGSCSGGICSISYIYYLYIMGQAQYAAGYLNGGTAPVSPSYQSPPIPQATQSQFAQVMQTLGYAIGTISAHETGHQLSLPQMDCGIQGNPACTEDNTYQNGGSGDNHLWFYGTAPGQQIHWSQDAICKIEKYLLGNSYKDKLCN